MIENKPVECSVWILSNFNQSIRDLKLSYRPEKFKVQTSLYLIAELIDGFCILRIEQHHMMSSCTKAGFEPRTAMDNEHHQLVIGRTVGTLSEPCNKHQTMTNVKRLFKQKFENSYWHWSKLKLFTTAINFSNKNSTRWGRLVDLNRCLGGFSPNLSETPFSVGFEFFDADI